MGQPTEPGFYWARFKRGGRWMVAEVERSASSGGVLRVQYPGEPESRGAEDVWSIDDFIWGSGPLQPPQTP